MDIFSIIGVIIAVSAAAFILYIIASFVRIGYKTYKLYIMYTMLPTDLKIIVNNKLIEIKNAIDNYTSNL